MQYRNITEESLSVDTVEGGKLVAPGDVVLTAPAFARPLVEAGKLEAIAPIPAKTTRKTAPKEAAE